MSNTDDKIVRLRGAPTSVVPAIEPRSTAVMPPFSHASAQEQPVGHFLPSDMRVSTRSRVIKAEVLWRSGLLKVTDICQRLGIEQTQEVYGWARQFHWPARADVVEQSQQALRKEQLLKAHAAWKKLQSPRGDTSSAGTTLATDATSESGNLSGPQPDESPVESTPPPTESGFGRETPGLAIREAAAADAASAQVLDEFVQVLGQVADAHQQTVRELQSWGDDIMREARRVHRAAKREMRGRKASILDRQKALVATVSNYRNLVAAMNVNIGMARRVFMLESPKGAPWNDSEQNSGGTSMGPTPVVAGTAGTYEDYIAQAEREGTQMTPV